MIPTRRLLLLLWLWVLTGIPATALPPVMTLWKLYGATLLALLLFELADLLRPHPLRWSRLIEGALPVGVWSNVELEVHNPLHKALALELFDFHPASCEIEKMPLNARLPAQGWTRTGYRLRPLQRGAYTFPGIQVRVFGRFGLLKRNRRYPLHTKIRVYPDFANVIKYSLLAHDQHQALMGIRKKRRRGEGMDFKQLREYRVGDSLRQIDWNATSRMLKLISREYQDERDQRIVFLVDCGRRMRALDGSLSHFDHTLNALLLVSYIALRQGDSVGLLTFGGEQRWLAPKKGKHIVNLMLNTVYDLQPGLQEPDYLDAALRLSSLSTKRALIVLITNLRDEDNEEILSSLQLLKRRNLILLASLRETAIDDSLDSEVVGFDDALLHAAGHKFLEYREKLHERIRQTGILTIDTSPARLAVDMANRYLQIKSSGML